MGRIFSETDLATNLKSEYTYDSLSRVTNRKITNLTDNTVTEESYTYDANGNILTSTVSTEEDTFVYDDSNRLVEYNGQAVTYDLDGNMLSANGLTLTYDSTNRLLSANGNTYTYDVENTRVKNLCNGVETTYTYNTNAELSQLLMKTVGENVTKYVYGNGLIGEESNNTFKTYHFDYRGSTVAITDTIGTVTDTFTYDSYGNVISRTGTTEAIFLYNGEYGVVTDTNGLLYMRARYYSPELRRFVNADILMGDINNSSTLNRYAYANGNPISNIDPFGLAADESRGGGPTVLEAAYMAKHIYGATDLDKNKNLGKDFGGWELLDIFINGEGLKIGIYYRYFNNIKYLTIANAGSEMNIFDDASGVWNDWIKNNFTQLFGNSQDMIDSITFAKTLEWTYPYSNITFVGHSKGGAEAAANAVATNNNAILFNPATVNLNAYELSSNDYNSNMTAYIVEGEILNKVFASVSTPIDDSITIGKDSFWSKLFKVTTPGMIYDTIESFVDHSINTVIKTLKKEGYK